MDDHEKEINDLKEQLNHLDIPKDLILPEFKLAFADISDELESFQKRKSSYHILLDQKQNEITKMKHEREAEINEEMAAIT